MNNRAPRQNLNNPEENPVRFRNFQEYRAQAGGNRHVHPVQHQQPQFVARPVVVPNQILRDNRDVLRRAAMNQQMNDAGGRVNNHNNNRHRRRAPEVAVNRLTREDVERIGTTARRSFQSRTAIQFDENEKHCWDNLLKSIDENSKAINGRTPPKCNGDVHVPTDNEVCLKLRMENQSEAINQAEELLSCPQATEAELRNALEKVEIFMKMNKNEFEMVEGITDEMMKSLTSMNTELDEMDNILSRISSIRIE